MSKSAAETSFHLSVPRCAAIFVSWWHFWKSRGISGRLTQTTEIQKASDGQCWLQGPATVSNKASVTPMNCFSQQTEAKRKKSLLYIYKDEAFLVRFYYHVATAVFFLPFIFSITQLYPGIFISLLYFVLISQSNPWLPDLCHTWLSNKWFPSAACGLTFIDLAQSI